MMILAIYDLNKPMCFKIKIDSGVIVSKEKICNPKYPKLNASQTYASEGVECDPIFIGDMIFWYTMFITGRGYEDIKFYRIALHSTDYSISHLTFAKQLTFVNCTTSSEYPVAGYLITAQNGDNRCRMLFDGYGKLHADDEPALLSFSTNVPFVADEAITIYADHGRFITKSTNNFIKPSIYREHDVFVGQGDGEINPDTMYECGVSVEHEDIWESIEFIEYYEGPALVNGDLIIRL